MRFMLLMIPEGYAKAQPGAMPKLASIGPRLPLGSANSSAPMPAATIAVRYPHRFDAATGPSRIVMMMTGHERDYVRIFGGIMLCGLIVEIAVIPFWGLLGAAAVNAGSRAFATLFIAWWNRRNIGIDTSLLGAFRVNHLRDGRPDLRPA